MELFHVASGIKGIANMTDFINFSEINDLNDIIISEFKKLFQTCFEIIWNSCLIFFDLIIIFKLYFITQ